MNIGASDPEASGLGIPITRINLVDLISVQDGKDSFQILVEI